MIEQNSHANAGDIGAELLLDYLVPNHWPHLITSRGVTSSSGFDEVS